VSDARPIGLFDSGVGGLTVVREIQRQLPQESTIYFADLAHFPYGPRYQAEVRGYALRIIQFLQGLDVKLVVIACNTATAAALNVARESFDIPVVGVISPGAQAAVAATRNNRVGVISTEGTLYSQEYLHAIKEANPAVGVVSKSCPDLVDLVESGRAASPEAEAALRSGLKEILDFGADTLILGCTHYPLLRPTIGRLTDGRLRVIDSAESTAAKVKRILQTNRLAAGSTGTASHRICVTGSPDRFRAVAAILFGSELPPIASVPAKAVEGPVVDTAAGPPMRLVR
jgi:glutamate racemase